MRVEWITERLEDCLEALIDYRGKSPTKAATGIPVLSAKVVKTGGLVCPIEQTIAVDYYAKWMTRGLPHPGDVVMTTEAPMGEVIQLDAETAQFALGQRIVCLRGKRGKIDNTFLRYLLISSEQQKLLASYATGTTVLGISQKALRSVPISYPTYNEQVQLGELLSALDDKIELNRRMNETLEASARALFRDWFVDFGPTRAKAEGRPAWLTPDLWSLFPDRLGDDGVPEGWTRRSIYDFADVVYGAPFASDRFNQQGIGRPMARIRDLPAHEADQFTDEVHRKEFVIQPGSIVVGMDGEFRARIWHGVPTLMNQRICAFEPKSADLRCFIWQSIEPLLASQEASAIGTTVIHLGKKDIDRFSALAPDERLLAAFGAAVEPLIDVKVKNGQEMRTLAATRDALLPKLMSGELRVRDAEALAA